MQAFIDGLAGGEFVPLLWVFLVFVVLHELEEWNINAYERRHFSEVPEYATDRSARGFILFFSIAALLVTSIATVAGDDTAAWIALPAVFFMLTNACQHVYWAIRFRGYAPGIGTAVALVVPIGAYLIARSVADGRVPGEYPVVLAVVSALVLIQTIRAGARMTASVRGAYVAGSWVRALLPG